jgi:hypothetical protein
VVVNLDLQVGLVLLADQEVAVLELIAQRKPAAQAIQVPLQHPRVQALQELL